MKELDKWMKEKFKPQENLVDTEDYLEGYEHGLEHGWKAALEWVLKERDPQGPGTSGEYVLDMIKEELND